MGIVHSLVMFINYNKKNKNIINEKFYINEIIFRYLFLITKYNICIFIYNNFFFAYI